MAEQRLIGEFISILEELRLDNPKNLDTLEEQAERMMRKVGRQLLCQLLEEFDGTCPPSKTRCRWCGMNAKYVSRKPAFVNTCFGTVRYRRAYYICPHCYRSTCPLDERLDPTASLGRLRNQLGSGKVLPIGELAQAWGLGSLKSSLIECTPLDQRLVPVPVSS